MPPARSTLRLVGAVLLPQSGQFSKGRGESKGPITLVLLHIRQESPPRLYGLLVTPHSTQVIIPADPQS